MQDEFEKFLNERGINTSVASFIPEYAAHKEQQVRILSCFFSSKLTAHAAFVGICEVVG